MKYLYSLITIVLFLSVITACKKGGADEPTPDTGIVTPDPNREISPTDANALAQVFTLNGATVITGAIPTSSPAAEAPAVLNLDKDVAYSAGSKLVMLTDVRALNNIKGVYVQVKGSNQYWDLPLNASIKNATVYIPLNLPKNIGEGTFILILKFYDINGKVSSTTEIKVTVTKPVSCGVTKVSGGQGLTSNLFKVPETGGQIKVAYQTFNVKDKIDIFQNGTWIGGTGPSIERSKLRKALDCSVATEALGYVGKKSEFLFTYNPTLGTEIEVVVSGCEDGGTKWEYTFSCPGDNKLSIPELTTTAISGIESNKAASGGTVTKDNGYDVTQRGVVWGTSPAPTIALTTKTTNGTSTGTFTSSLANLLPNTKYYVRAYATNIVGTGYGNEISFTTQTLAVPTVTTTAISNITGNSAQSGGNVTSGNNSTVTARGVVWSTSPSPTVALGTKTTNGTGTGTFTSGISGLLSNTKYYVRAYATNGVGTAYGSEVSFTTSVVINLSLDGVWANDGGTKVSISGNTGIFTAFSPSWQQAAAKGFVSIGGIKFKNIVKKSTYVWECVEQNIESQLGVPIKAIWSEVGTMTMSSNGKTITVVTLNKLSTGNKTSTVEWVRQ